MRNCKAGPTKYPIGRVGRNAGYVVFSKRSPNAKKGRAHKVLSRTYLYIFLRRVYIYLFLFNKTAVIAPFKWSEAYKSVTFFSIGLTKPLFLWSFPIIRPLERKKGATRVAP